MCYSRSASFSSFTLGMGVNALLYIRNTGNDRWAAYMITSVVAMQFLEGLMWSDLKCKGLNQFASLCAYLLLIVVQPLLSIYGASTFGVMDREWMYFYLSMWAIYASACLYFAWPTPAELCSTVSENGNLMWPWWSKVPDPCRFAYFLLCVTPWAFMRPLYQAGIYTIWLLVIYLASFKKTPIESSIASVYCFFVAFTGLLPLLLW